MKDDYKALSARVRHRVECSVAKYDPKHSLATAQLPCSSLFSALYSLLNL